MSSSQCTSRSDVFLFYINGLRHNIYPHTKEIVIVGCREKREEEKREKRKEKKGRKKGDFLIVVVIDIELT
jgi:hypothetical protein